MHHQTAFDPLPPLQLRPVCAADRAAMCRFLQGLSPASRGLRFHGAVKPDSERLLAHLTQADGRRHIAFVAVLACHDGDLIVGEVRCVSGQPGEPAEFAIAVADAWQGRGLARQLLGALLAAAAAAGIDSVVAEVLEHNGRMAAFMGREGFVAAPAGEAGVRRWARSLAVPGPARRGWSDWLGHRLGPLLAKRPGRGAGRAAV